MLESGTPAAPRFRMPADPARPIAADPAADPVEVRRRALRRDAIGRREALDDATWQAANARLLAALLATFASPPGRHIAFCWPVRREPDLRDAIAHWCAAGAVAALPVVVAEDAPLAFRAWTPASRLAHDRYGIPTPAEGETVVPDVLLLPLNAFDAAGYRIGYGGGYFDRTLAAAAARPLSIGVGFEVGRVADTEPQPHDQALDWIVTDAGAFRPRRR